MMLVHQWIHKQLHPRNSITAGIKWMIVVLLLASCKKPAPVDPPVEKEQYYFYEDFSGTAVDPAKWLRMSLPYSSGNFESQWYRPDNLEVSNGTLKITSRKETFSGPAYQAPVMSFVSSDGIMRASPQEGLPAGTRYWTSGLINTREAATPRYFPYSPGMK
ncbi:glycoside hydrolase family 16 protein [Niabella hibiscisoli]|uniref:glycoside hydrolase family 16 protein n=1 Tax=Niabella hibiscisoli TaxID=1825928 RepID=UPI001F112598|nr:hypothetical protein [Niabella hibiscisoli]MCH5715174.1 hypothetical protein [Niabella hibiscisoli]